MISLILSFLIINTSADVGTAGFNFLKIAPSAKEAAMANTGIGLENNQSGFSFLYNPAAVVKTPMLGVGYLNYLAGISYGAIGYSKQAPFSFLKSGGIGVTYLNSGNMKRTDINGSELGTFTVSYLNLNTAGNITLMQEKLNCGLGVKILYGSIDTFFGLGIATDFGIRYKPGLEGLTVGAVFKNLGYQIKAFDEARDKIPLDFGIGFGYSMNTVNLALDIHKPIDNTVLVNLGAEAWVNKYLALRGGYNSMGKDYKTGGTSDILSGFSTGMGIEYLKYRVDYSFTPIGNLGQLHHIALFFSL